MTSTEVDKDVTRSLQMSLEDIIKEKKAGSSKAGAARGGRAPRGGAYGGRATGPVRRTYARGVFRPTPYASSKPTPMATDNLWQHDMFAQAPILPSPLQAIETGTKLYVSNLDFGVSNEDIKELFSEIGELKKCSVNYDRSGRSKGTAEVVFARKADAVAAMAKYNNVLLDKKPMKIELIGTNLTTVTQSRLGPTALLPIPMKRSVPVTAASNRAALAASYELQHQNQAQGRFRPRGGFSPPFRGVGVRGRGRGRFNRKSQQTPVTQDQLDADLDSYHAEKGTGGDAMET